MLWERVITPRTPASDVAPSGLTGFWGKMDEEIVKQVLDELFFLLKIQRLKAPFFCCF